MRGSILICLSLSSIVVAVKDKLQISEEAVAFEMEPVSKKLRLSKESVFEIVPRKNRKKRVRIEESHNQAFSPNRPLKILAEEAEIQSRLEKEQTITERNRKIAKRAFRNPGNLCPHSNCHQDLNDHPFGVKCTIDPQDLRWYQVKSVLGWRAFNKVR